MSQIDHVVIDVEIQKTIEELPNGWDDTDQMGVSCAVVYEFLTDRFRVYGPNDVDALKTRLLNAEKISGFNIWAFDFPVIFGLKKRMRVEPLRAKCNDLLRRLWQAKGLDADNFTKATHAGYGLDAVAKSTLNVGKIGFGGDAPKWFQAGQLARVINYCVDDVAIERDLTRFADRYGFVLCGSEVIRLRPWNGA